MFYVFWWVYKDSFGTKSDKIVLECKMCHIPDVFPKARHWRFVKAADSWWLAVTAGGGCRLWLSWIEFNATVCSEKKEEKIYQKKNVSLNKCFILFNTAQTGVSMTNPCSISRDSMMTRNKELRWQWKLQNILTRGFQGWQDRWPDVWW
jgi:hypothetical protein